MSFDLRLSIVLAFLIAAYPMYHMSHDMRFPTMWYVRSAQAQIRAFAGRLNILRLLGYWEFLSLKGGYTGWSETTLVKMPHC